MACLEKPVNCLQLFHTIMQLFGKEVVRVSQLDQDMLDEQQIMARIGGARVLLVEDNVINQQVAQEILAGIGLVVECAGDGVAALRRLETFPYDIVLMDIQMPVMDGYTATRQIRQQQRFVDLPIIAMTANVTVSDQQKCLEAGMNDHVAKPIAKKELFAALLKWIKPQPGQSSVMLPQHKIVLVDDVPANLKMLKACLAADYELYMATDGYKALKIVAANPPDLILLDVNMLGMDGFNVLERLKANPATRHIPVILLTANDTSVAVMQGLQAGACDYVTQPFAAAQLRLAIAKH